MAFQTVLASLICIIIGLLIGYVVLLIINPAGSRKSHRCDFEELFLLSECRSGDEVFRNDADQSICPVDVCSVRSICLQSGPV